MSLTAHTAATVVIQAAADTGFLLAEALTGWHAGCQAVLFSLILYFASGFARRADKFFWQALCPHLRSNGHQHLPAALTAYVLFVVTPQTWEAGDLVFVLACLAASPEHA